MTKKQERLAQQVVAALVRAETATGEQRANHIREAAVLASELRMTFATSKDDERPDIRGRSYGYRTAMAEVFEKAESSQEIRSAFRYHSNIVHKQRVGPEALREFGIDERTRNEQWNDRRRANQADAAVGRAQRVTAGPASAKLRELKQAERILAALHVEALGSLPAADKRRARALGASVAAVAAEILRVTK